MLKLRQPSALKPLVFSQSLERVGSMLLLILIATLLTESYHMDDQSTFNLIGSFSALSIAGYIVGGLLSDRLLGFRLCIIWGCSLLCLGNLLLATRQIHYLYAGLALISVGSALFTPNLSAFLSDFFYERDPRRNSGFIWLYMAMNIGTLVASVVAAMSMVFYGWQLAFYISAGTALLAGLLFIRGKNTYESRGKMPRSPALRSKIFSQASSILIILALCAIFYFLLKHVLLNNVILIVIAIVVLAALYISSLYQSTEKKYRLIRLVFLIIFSVVFWAVCIQEYLTIPLFINRVVGAQYNQTHIPTPIYFALNALLVALFCPILARLWQQLHKKRKEPTPGVKIALSLISLGVAMTILTVGSLNPHADFHVSATWVFVAFVFIALGESLLYPTGLSLTSILAPRKWRGLLIALWFMTMGMGSLLGTRLARQASVTGIKTHLHAIDHVYAQAFAHYAILAYSAGILMFILLPIIKKLTPIHLAGSPEH